MYPFRHRRASALALSLVPTLLLASSQKRLKSYSSPEKAITATIMTISPGKNQTEESNVEFRTSSRRFIGAKTFVSKLCATQPNHKFDNHWVRGKRNG